MRNYHNITLCHGYQFSVYSSSDNDEEPPKIPCDRPLTNDEVGKFVRGAGVVRVMPDNTCLVTTRRMQLHRLHEFFDEHPLTERMARATSPEFVLLSNYARIAQGYANFLRRSAGNPVTREEVELDNLAETDTQAFNERFESAFHESDNERAISSPLHQGYYRYYTGQYGRQRREEREEDYRQYIEEGYLSNEPDTEGAPVDPRLANAQAGDTHVFESLGVVSIGDFRIKIKNLSTDLPDFSSYGVTPDMNDDQITANLRQAYENARQAQTRARIDASASNVLKTCTNKVGKAAFICGAPIFLPYFLVKLIGAYITLSDVKANTRAVEKDMQQYFRSRNIKQELTPALQGRMREHLGAIEADGLVAPVVPDVHDVPPDLFDDPVNEHALNEADPLLEGADNEPEDMAAYAVVDPEDVRQALLGRLGEETRATALSLNGHAINTSSGRPSVANDAPPAYRRVMGQDSDAPPSYEEAVNLPTVIKP